MAPYRDGAIFTAKFAGTSAWERHPQGDEIVQIVDGATTLHLMTAEGTQSVTLSAGMMVVVPQNTWHQFDAPDGVCVMTATPQPTEHLRVDVDDPRTLEKQPSLAGITHYPGAILTPTPIRHARRQHRRQLYAVAPIFRPDLKRRPFRGRIVQVGSRLSC